MDYTKVESRLADLWVDPGVKDLSRALIALARVEDEAKATVALVWAAVVVMHANLIATFRMDPAAAEGNRAVYLDLLHAMAKEVQAGDLQRLSELASLPVAPGPQRPQ